MATHGDDEETCLFALKLISSVTLPMTLRAAIELGLLETLVKAKGKALTPQELAAKLPASKHGNNPNPNPGSASMVDRMLRLLACYEVVSCEVEHGGEGDGGLSRRRYRAAPVCRWLAPSHEDAGGVSLAPFHLIANDRLFMDAWFHLEDAVLAGGGSPFNRALSTTSWFAYAGTDARFNRAMNEAMRQHSVILTSRLLERYGEEGFAGVGTLVDVGGGVGATVHAITSRFPGMRGVNFDLPHVVADAPAYPRVDHVGGDMFDKVPSTDDGGAILIKWILNCFGDEQCATLLRNCHDALPPNGKVIDVECIMPATPDATHGAQGLIGVDMTLLAYSPDGRERYEAEFVQLAKRAGFTGFKKTYIFANFWAMEYTK